MYKIYILKKRKGRTEVLTETKTSTAVAEIAEAAFWILRNSKRYQSKNLLLLMTLNSRQLNAHWFDRKSGDEEYIEIGDKLRLQNE